MGSVTKAIRFLLLGDDKSAVSALRNVSKEMKNTGKSGAGLKGMGKDMRAALKDGGGMKALRAEVKATISGNGGIRGLSKEFASAARSGDGMRKVTALFSRVTKDAPILRKMGSSFGAAAQEAGGLGSVVGKVGVGMAAVGAAAVAAGVAIAIKFGADSISTFKRVAAETLKLSRVTGMSTEDASRLGFAFQQTGIDADTGARSIQLFEKNTVKMAAANSNAKAKAQAKADAIRAQISALEGAGSKTKGYADKLKYLKEKLSLATAAGHMNASALGELGVTYTDAHGKMLPMAQLLPAVADKFSKMPDGAEKTAIAMKLFGKSGTAMLPFLNKGAAGLAELAKKSDAFGATLSGSQLDALKKSRQAQRDWDAAMQGLQVTLGSELLPLVTDFAVGINNTLIPAITWMTGEIKKNETGFTAFGNGMKWVWNNILMPVFKLLIWSTAESAKGVGSIIAAIGHMSGNKDMENFGNSIVSAANDVEGLAAGMKGIDYTVTPTVDAKTEKAKTDLTAVDKTIKGLKDKIVTAKAKGDSKGLDTLNAKLAAAEKKQHTLKATIKASLDGGTDQLKLNINRGGKTGVLRMYRQGGRPRVGEPAIFHQDEVWVPDEAGTVISQSRSRQMARAGGPVGIGGGGVNLTVNVTVPVGADRMAYARETRTMMVELFSKTGLRVP